MSLVTPLPTWKIQSLRSDYVARLHRETLKMVSEDDSLGWVSTFLRVHASIVASGAALVLCMPLGGATVLAVALVWNIVVSAEYAWWRGGAPSAAWRAKIREHYRFVAPLSALMILPDSYLVNVLGTLRFPAAPLKLLGVPAHMGLMWSMNLLPMLVVLDACKPHAADVLPLAAAAHASSTTAAQRMIWPSFRAQKLVQRSPMPQWFKTRAMHGLFSLKVACNAHKIQETQCP